MKRWLLLFCAALVLEAIPVSVPAIEDAASATNARLAAAQASVEKAYKDILRREPDSGGMATFTDHLVNQGKDESWLRRTLSESDEGLRARAEARKALLARTVRVAGLIVLLAILAGLVTRFRLWKQVLLMSGAGMAALLVLEMALRLLPLPSAGSALSRHDRSPIYYQIAPERQHPTEEEGRAARRVAIVGDSFTRGVGVQVDDRFAAKLERMLNANAGVRPVVVDVFDEPGTSTFQQWPLLERALEKKPELVVLSVCLNDTEDWKRPHELRKWREEGQPAPPTGLRRALVRSSRLLALAHGKLQLRRAKSGYVRYYRRLYDPQYTGWKRFEESVAAMRGACAAQGASFVVLIHPLLSDPFSEALYPFQFAHDAIHAHLRSLQIPFVDTLPQLRNTLHIRMSAVPEIDPHPSEIAHRLTAETLFDFFLANGYFGPEHALKWRESERQLAERWRLASDLMDPLAERRR